MPRSSPVHIRSGRSQTWPPNGPLPEPCGCDGAAVRAVRHYLLGCFPTADIRDAHERSVAAMGPSRRYADYHVLHITDGEAAYHALLAQAFLAWPLTAVRAHLWRWDIAGLLERHRIAIVSEHDISPL